MLSRFYRLLKHRRVLLLIEILFFVLLYLGVRAYVQRDLVEGQAPHFISSTLTGEVVDLAQPRTRPVLIHFWATWCAICRLEQDSINSIARDHDVISIAMTSGDAMEVRQFIQDEGLSFPVINDPQGELARRYGVRGVPTSFVVNSKGMITAVERGYTTEWGLRLRLWWSR